MSEEIISKMVENKLLTDNLILMHDLELLVNSNEEGKVKVNKITAILEKLSINELSLIKWKTLIEKEKDDN